MIRLTVQDRRGTRTIATKHSELLVGSAEGGLQLEGGGISPQHCLLRVEGKRVTLVDLGSEAGTVVDGKRTPAARLAHGAVIVIGEARVRLDEFTPGAPAAAASVMPAPVPAGVESDFGREIRAMLKKTPWYMTSLAVHVVALLLLGLVPFRTYETKEAPVIAAVDEGPDARLEEDVEEFAPETEDMRPEEVLENLEPDVASEEEKAAQNEEFTLPPDYVPPEHLGTGSNLDAPIKKLTKPVPTKYAQGAPGKVDKSNLEKEQRDAKKTVERGLGGGLTTLGGLARDRILVVEGDFDKMELVLDLYEIPYTLVSRAQLLRNPYPRAQIICLNCARKPLLGTRKNLVKRIRRFVKAGGWVISSDWAVDPFVTGAFPQFIRVRPPTNRQRDTTVEVSAKQPTSPLLEGVFAHHGNTRWWLEETSTFVTIDPKRVDVLVESEEMRTRYGSGAVAVEFRPSPRGRVVHLLGHFYQKDGTKSGLVAMQRLILNFLLERFPTK